MENTGKLNHIENKLVSELMRINLGSIGIKCGKFTKKGIQILDDDGKKILGYVERPDFDVESLYDEYDSPRKMSEVLVKALKIKGHYVFEEEMKFEEISTDEYDYSEYKAKNNRRLTDFVCGEDFFIEGDYIDRIDTRGDFDEDLLDCFWAEIEDEGTYPLCALSELKNISIAHYKGKYWEVHNTFFMGDVEVYHLGEKEGRSDLMRELKERDYKITSYIFDSVTMFYRYTAKKEDIERDSKQASDIIEKSAYSLEFDSGVKRVIDHLFDYMSIEDRLEAIDEVHILATRIREEQGDLGGLFSCADEISSALFQELIISNHEIFKLDCVGEINFIQKAREYISQYGTEFRLEFEEGEVFYKNCMNLDGIWKLVGDNQEYHLDWDRLIFDTEEAIEEAIGAIGERVIIKSLSSNRKEDLKRAFDNSSNFIVHLNDSFVVGNCEFGTRDFCMKHNIDIDKTTSIMGSKLCEIIEKEEDSTYKHLAENVLLFAYKRYAKATAN